ncbi:anti-adapter protein iraM [Mixta intestinalis]|uniref:Anti-adapter protein IraM n=1 Tax=Mixta intestinalis TaxID=1615494 RepID=A0A6P1PY66_9GAMM|nr:anti-adapter protein iraM [Mixta intestinalis]QHM70748.1 Anti-adapter protein IraM [Mixta intestinalis]
MLYNVMDSLVCPLTGTVFTCAINSENLKLIIWYQGEKVARSGDVLDITENELAINGVTGDIAIITVMPFNRTNWALLSARTGCPANGPVRPVVACPQQQCRFPRCPYELEKASIACR